MADFTSITEDTSPGEIAKQIGAELFAPDPDSKPSGDSTPLGSGDAPQAGSTEQAPEKPQETPAQAPQVPAVSPNPAAPQVPGLKALPKSWKKETQPIWEKLDPAAHDYIYQREQDMMKGLQQYQDGHSRWNEVLQPFAHVMQQHPDVNPVPLLQNLMTNHLRILSSDEPTKIQMAKAILQGYGIPLEKLGLSPAQGEPNSELLQLRQEIHALKSAQQTQARTAYETEVAKNAEIVSAFFADPKNEFAEELGDDIAKLLKTGVAENLPQAYELACWANSGVRAKMLAKQAASSQPSTQANKPKPTNIEPNGAAVSRPRKPKSIDETIDAVIAKNYGTTH
jgi:hypothetical protein